MSNGQAGSALDQPFVRAAIWFIGLLALVNVGAYIFAAHPREFAADFNHLWAGGKCWAGGASPYGVCQAEVASQSGAPNLHDPPQPFVYPPAIVLVLAPLGLLSIGDATFAWSIVSFMGLIAASALFAAWPTSASPARRLTLFALHAAVAGGLWEAADVIGAQNNADFFIYGGFMAALIGAGRGNTVLYAVGLTLCLMRPQIGLPLFFASLASPDLRRGAFAAAGATAMLSLAGLAPGGVIGPLLDFFRNLGGYGSYPENAPIHSGGVGFLVLGATGLSLSTPAAIGLSAIAAFSASLAARGCEIRTQLLIGVALGLFMLPGHNTYYIVLTPLLLTAQTLNLRTAMLGLGMLCMMKVWTISLAMADRGIGYLQVNAAAVDSFGLLLTACACLGAIHARRSAAAPQPA